MYALVNTMSAVENIVGRIVSQHLSVEACEKACNKLQKLTKQFEGDTSYVPTVIVKLDGRYPSRALIGRDSVVEFY
jgi:3-methyladenine DNA glycosylase/8-oxoguanine DNA glycosylase